MARKKPSEAIREAVAPKKRGRKPIPKPAIEFKDGLQEISNIEAVKITEIDLEDRRFQYRLSEKLTDLIPSLINDGQLVPVILWGSQPPYKILDGFRRSAAIKQVGWESVRAIIHRKISEEDAYRLSFIENFKRKNFSPIDVAHAIWKAIARGKGNKELESEFNFSERQIQRYKKMIEFSDQIKQALSEGSITMAHARVLDQFKVKDILGWIEKIKAGLSAKALKKELAKEVAPKTKPRKFMKKEDDGFRLYPIRYTATATAKSREAIKKVLKDALAIIEQDEQKGENP